MSAVAPIKVTEATGSVKQQRATYGKAIRVALEDEKRAAITAGLYLMLSKATFTADELDEWKAWSVSVSRKSYKTVESYLAVGKAYASSTATLQGKIKDWTFEALQAYASVTPDDRATVVAEVGDSSPTVEAVRTTRDAVKDSKLSESERKQRAADKSKREKQRAEDKTVEMVKSLSPMLNKLQGDREFDAFKSGLVIGLGYTASDEKLLTAAVKQYRTQRDASVTRVQRAAERLAASATK